MDGRESRFHLAVTPAAEVELMAQMSFLEILHIIESQYPDAMAILSQPGVADVYIRYVKSHHEGDAGNPPMTDAQFQAEIRRTPWWQQTPDAQRKFQKDMALDPATTRQKVQDTDKSVRAIAGALGIPPMSLDPLMVLQATSEQWDESRIRMELVARSKSGDARGPGAIGQTMTEYKGLAEDYGVRMKDDDLYWWGANTQGGTVTEDGFKDFITQQAKALFPALAPALDEGLTVRQYASPYFAMAQEELGIGDGQISLTNPKWMDLVLGTDDKGQQGVRSLSEALAHVRTDPGYGYDSGLPARTKAAEFASQLTEMFGG
jgi:hypothetical protein